jgi:uncharacterized protein YukE
VPVSPAALRAAAARVEGAGGRLAPALDRTASELRPTVWLGPAATRLSGDLTGGRRRLVAARAALASAAAAMRAEADRIEAEARLLAAAAALGRS